MIILAITIPGGGGETYACLAGSTISIHFFERNFLFHLVRLSRSVFLPVRSGFAGRERG